MRVGKQTWVTTKIVAESNTNKNVMTKIKKKTNVLANTNTREKSKKTNLGPLIRQRRRWWWLDLGGRGLLGHNDRHQAVRLLLVGGQVPIDGGISFIKAIRRYLAFSCSWDSHCLGICKISVV